MEFTFTAAQRDQLVAAYESADGQYQGNKSTAGIFTPLYDLILSFISDADGQPLAGVNEAVFAWIAGARDVNANEGGFAAWCGQRSLN